MSQREKIVTTILSAFVFFGLFFFIYTSMKSTPASRTEDSFAGMDEDFNFDVDDSTATFNDTPLAEDAAAPAEAPAKKK